MIGNPTNIYLALFKNIGFMEYLSVMWLPALVGGIVSFGVMFALFYRQLRKPISPSFEHFSIKKPMVIIGLVHLALCTVLLAIADMIKVEMWIISTSFALSLFVVVCVYKFFKREHFVEVTHTLKRAPWGLIPFMVSMFIIVSALDYTGATATFASFLSFGEPVFTYGISSTLACNVVNNIPMSVLFGSLINVSGGSIGAVYASVIGSNIGAFLTPIGALAGIMWSNILKAQKVKIGYLKFVLYGCIIAVPTLLSSLFALWLIV
jgi:arsenical pump membrane protein